MDLMIHRFEHSTIFGDSEEYEEHTNLASCKRRLDWLVATYGTEFSFWAEDADGNIYNAEGDEPCGYCGHSTDPNDICATCFTNLK